MKVKGAQIMTRLRKPKNSVSSYPTLLKLSAPGDEEELET